MVLVIRPNSSIPLEMRYSWSGDQQGQGGTRNHCKLRKGERLGCQQERGALVLRHFDFVPLLGSNSSIPLGMRYYIGKTILSQKRIL